MDYRLTIAKEHGYKAAIAEFAGMECHVIIEPYDKEASAAECVSFLEQGMKTILENDLNGFRPVFKRWFLSDAACQADLIPVDETCAASVIQQPPMDGSKAVLWVWMMKSAPLKPVSGRIWYLWTICSMYKKLCWQAICSSFKRRKSLC